MADDSSGMAAGALGNLFSAGMGFATGNPIAAISGIAGLGMSIMGGVDKAAASKQYAQQMTAAETSKIQLEQQQEGVRQQAMDVSARRQNMEVLRNAQRARALGLNAATNQGAQFGSGLQGGYGQISGASNTNLAGIQGSLDLGNQMFGLNNQISQQKIAMAQAQGQYQSSSATAQGMSSLGSGLLGASSSLKNLGTLSPSSSSSGGGGSGSSSYGGWMSSMGTGGLV